MSKAFKIIVVLFTIIFVVFAAMFGVLAAQMVAGQSFGEEIYIPGLEKDTGQVGMVNMLLIGVDDGGYRSDTIMLLSIDGYSGRANILSIPRDTRVKADGYTVQKINALMGLGQDAAKSGKIDEPEEILINMVKEMTGLPIHYFMTVDFDGFKDIIDALDGVDFNIPYNMDYDDPTQNLHIHLKAGQQHLDGQAAHDFVRFRHNNKGEGVYAPGEYAQGDIGRIGAQQNFLKELFRQKMQPQYLLKASELLTAAADDVKTNFTISSALDFIGVLKSTETTEIESFMLPGEARYIGKVSYYVYSPSATKELILSEFGYPEGEAQDITSEPQPETETEPEETEEIKKPATVIR